MGEGTVDTAANPTEAGRTDETRDDSSPRPLPDGPRRCGYSRCRRPLQEGGAGRKAEYCRETRWELEGRAVACRELARAERLLVAAHGHQESTATVDTVELGEQISSALDGARALEPVANRLVESLRGVRSQLDEDVAAARTTAATAERDAADASGRAEAAEAAQAAAESDMRAALQDRDSAEEAKQDAERARLSAENAQARAEGQRDTESLRAKEIEERLRAVTDDRDQVAQELTATATELRTTRETLADTRSRLQQATDRLNQLVGEHAQAMDRLHRENAAETERMRAAQVERVEELNRAHVEAVASARHESEQRVQEIRDELTRTHARELAEAHAQIGTLENQLTTAQDARRQEADELERWRAALAEPLAETSDELGELRARIAWFTNG